MSGQLQGPALQSTRCLVLGFPVCFTLDWGVEGLGPWRLGMEPWRVQALAPVLWGPPSPEGSTRPGSSPVCYLPTQGPGGALTCPFALSLPLLPAGVLGRKRVGECLLRKV